MKQSAFHYLFALLLIAFDLGIAATPARADAGPKPRRQEVMVTRATVNGDPIPIGDLLIRGRFFGGRGGELLKHHEYHGPMRKIELSIEYPSPSRIHKSNSIDANSIFNYLTVELDAEGIATFHRESLFRAWPDFYFVRNVGHMGVALAVTLAIELPIVLIWSLLKKSRVGRFLGVALLANMASLPIAWAVLSLGLLKWDFGQAYGILFAVVEATVVILEGLFYSRMADVPLRQALRLSFFVNLASMLSGFCMAFP